MDISRLRWVTPAAGLALFTCSPVEPSFQKPVPAAIALVSGENQDGRVGEQLGEPFVVRVTDAQGDPLGNVFVSWEVTEGAGDLSTDVSVTLSDQAITVTDNDGLARVFFTPTALGTSTVAARVSSAGGLPGSPLSFTIHAPGPATIARVSGEDQEGRVGERLAEPFMVRVTDVQGAPMAGVSVVWSLTEGDGDLLAPASGTGMEVLATTTDASGLAQAFFIPKAVGPSTIVARVQNLPKLLGSPVPFATHAPGLQLSIWLSLFWGPCAYCSPDVTVPVGTTVEWRNWDLGEHAVTSSSAPPGGASFSSGILHQDDRFHFVPNVAGTWEYFDRVYGARATLTAK